MEDKILISLKPAELDALLNAAYTHLDRAASDRHSEHGGYNVQTLDLIDGAKALEAGARKRLGIAA